MVIESSIDADAQILWNYLQLHKRPIKSDVIFCLCSHDTRVAERAAELLLAGLAEFLIFSGGAGKLTRSMFTKPEADHFAEIARIAGVPNNKIIIENKSTNTGENITFTHSLLERLGIRARSLILVQKPYMERRTYATFKKQWPDPNATIIVTSPQYNYEDYVSGGVISKDSIINVMVGDMQRIREYPKQGFQITQDIPDNVWDAYTRLITAGFSKCLIRS